MLKSNSNFARYFLLIIGWISLAVGILGLILPIFPGAIFIILAAWSFSRSSQKYYSRLTNHPYVGTHIRNFIEKKGIPLKAKFVSVLMFLSTICLSIYFLPPKPFLIVILLLIALGVSGYIISLNTINHTSVEEENF